MTLIAWIKKGDICYASFRVAAVRPKADHTSSLNHFISRYSYLFPPGKIHTVDFVIKSLSGCLPFNLHSSTSV
ncbi:hypothetical protein N7445_003882 [Penicillium cf. griseofulvum]|nr:hypothetical protein N7445_003882 [Penicillium cf. griseofulvum]